LFNICGETHSFDGLGVPILPHDVRNGVTVMSDFEEHTAGSYYDEHKFDEKDIKCGWAVALVVILGLVILTL
jgi:hypothetical protein